MRILLISANQEMNPYPVEPLGVAYVAASLLEAGHEVRVLDLCFEPNGPEVAAAAAREFEADLVGISIRNIDNLTFPKSVFYLPLIKSVIDELRSTGSYPIVVGGSGFSLFPHEALSYLEADYGIVGEGEEGMTSLAGCLENGAALPTITGLVTRTGSSETPCISKSMDFVSLSPARSLLKYRRYGEYGAMSNVQTKRGCPFRCIYCTYPLLEGSNIRLREPGGVVDEVEKLQKDYGADYFFFVDDIFNVPQSHAVGICEEIIRRGIAVQWACFATPKHVSPELFRAMKKAGCNAVEFGTDGGADETLTALEKGFTLSEVERAQEMCSNAGIEAAHYLIIGGPAETPETIAETFRFMERIRPRAVIAMLGVRIYPGTGLVRRAVNEGIIDEGESLLEPKFYISREVRRNVLDVVGEYARSRHNWVVPGLDIRSSEKLSRRLAALGKRGVMWDLLGSTNIM
ncbi:MAG: lipid biosynthesis B12-binding/radical SAM protein [Thermodesulfobacteriota bacterium]